MLISPTTVDGQKLNFLGPEFGKFFLETTPTQHQQGRHRATTHGRHLPATSRPGAMLTVEKRLKLFQTYCRCVLIYGILYVGTHQHSRGDLQILLQILVLAKFGEMSWQYPSSQTTSNNPTRATLHQLLALR